MRIAVSSDEPYGVNTVVVDELKKRGHEVVLFGSVATGREESWVQATVEAVQAVADGVCDEAVVFCWTGTGASIAANKVRGIRAALCVDPETARGARIWNHANVLALSNRLLSDDRAKEIVAAWLDTPPGDPKGRAGVDELMQLDAERH